MKQIIIILLSLLTFQGMAQKTDSLKANLIQKESKTQLATTSIFPEKCIGIWEGMMYIYRHSQLIDSVKVKFTVAKTDSVGTYIWKKEYFSPKRPTSVKDYKLIVDDINKGRYILDEGDGVKLIEFNVGNKLYSSFKVDDIYLTSSTELIDDTIIFEVTSGKEFNEVKGIKNFSFAFVQRVVFQRVDKK